MRTSFTDLTTLGIGGLTGEFIESKTEEDLISTIKKLPSSESFFLLGGGSNLLVSDEDSFSTVIKNEDSGITQDKNTITVKSGTLLSKLVDFANDAGLSGLEKMAGIPGTIGGAIYGNAGAYGQTISDNIIKVLAFDPFKFRVHELSKEECRFDYRFSVFKVNKFIILEAVFSLKPSEASALKKISKETIKKREVKYPPGIKCPGSFFKNIPAEKLDKQLLKNVPAEFVVYNKVSAGALLESVGAKGARIGNILIAPYHANLFINEGNGRAQDFYDLARRYQERVYDKYGIKLEPEVQLINLPQL